MLYSIIFILIILLLILQNNNANLLQKIRKKNNEESQLKLYIKLTKENVEYLERNIEDLRHIIKIKTGIKLEYQTKLACKKCGHIWDYDEENCNSSGADLCPECGNFSLFSDTIGLMNSGLLIPNELLDHKK